MVIDKNQIIFTQKMTKPYTENHLVQEGTNQHYIIRTFDKDVLEEELVWHRDKRTRKVTTLTANGWQFQKEDCLPEPLEQGKEIMIHKNTYHRLIKGDGELVVRILEI